MMKTSSREIVKYDDLTSQQQECVDHDEKKDLLIRGIAGSGKSLVLAVSAAKTLERAKANNKKVKIALVTYANTLVSFTREYMEYLGVDSDSIIIDTADSLLKNVYSQMYNKGKTVLVDYGSSAKFNNNYSKVFYGMNNVVKDMNTSEKGRFLDYENREMMDFVRAEIYWIKQHWSKIKSKSDYVELNGIKRLGRGRDVVPTKKERALLYDIYEAYFNKMRKEKPFIYDAEEIFARIDQNKDDIPENLKYDYVYIDECQDLSLTKLSALIGLSKKGCKLAADVSQKIYSTGFSWSELGINLKGNNSKKLTGTFRNSKEIWNLAESLKKYNEEIKEEPENVINAEVPERSTGVIPQIYFEKDEKSQQNRIVNLIKEIQKQKDCSIGILLSGNRKSRYSKGNSIEEMENALECVGISDIDIIQGKDGYEIISPGVKLVTYHSSKGLEFDVVILPFLNNDRWPKLTKDMDEELRKQALTKARNLLYVGMTRARNLLIMICDGEPSPLINALDNNMYESIGR